ncbi:alpha/beta hydrolase [Actinophytocola sp.]|uniref:alpha/beta hydrolase n=1 Tax=Actinophytocola sp. TaxID=1872138 RepID=UPI002ED0EE03
MRRRSLLTLLAGTLVATGTALMPGTAVAEPAAAINWQPCPEPEAAGVDCATIEVPLDYSKPRGEKVQIGLARRPATDPSKRIGSILVDPGGPGGSGVSMIKFSEPFTDEVNARFDRIGFDPRGINTSSQLRCDVDLLGSALDARHPTSQADFDELARRNRALHDNCRENSSGLANHVDNLHTVRDMDAIRAALGERKLTFLGYSYGSLMGQQYAEVFPHRVRALVMDGNMNHSIDSVWEFMRTETAPIEQAFVEFANWCDTTETCDLYGLDTKAVYADLKARAKAGTLVDLDGEPVSFYDLSNISFATSTPQVWSLVGEYLRQLRDGAGATSTDIRAAFGELVNSPYPVIWCSDWRLQVRSYAEYAGLRARLAQRFPNVEYSRYVDHALTCVGSGTKTTNPQRPLDIDDAPPLVMIGNIHDPATVYEWTLAAARQSGARLVTYEGWGHTAYGNGGPSECVNAAVDAYLINLKPPRRGLSCPSTDTPALTTAKAQTPHPAGPYQH